MAKRPRVAPEFSARDLEDIEAANEAVLSSPLPTRAPKPLKPSPQAGGMGMQGGKAGGFWYKKGGKVTGRWG
jgi:hypothetical protein